MENQLVKLFPGGSEEEGKFHLDSEEIQGSEVNQVSINDLPAEMLMKIVKYLDFDSLLNCRLVNLNWNGIATQIFRQESTHSKPFEFRYRKGSFECSVKKKERSLMDFNKDFENSKTFPISHFCFWGFDSKNVGNVDVEYADFFQFSSVMSFVKVNEEQEARIKTLELIICHPSHELIQKLGNLLVNKLTHLERLKLYLWFQKEKPELKATSLFPTAVTLPHLKYLLLSPTLGTNFPEVAKDLLEAAINLKSIELYTEKEDYHNEEILYLHSLGKPYLVENADISMDENFIKEFQSHGNSIPVLKFQALYLGELDPELDPDSSANAANVLSSLFEASKQALKKLWSIEPLGFLKPCQFPIFKNLSILNLHCYSSSSQSQFFPRGIRERPSFPAVTRLEIRCYDWARSFPYRDSMPLFPLIQNLDLEETGLSQDSIWMLALMCPNLKSFKIHRWGTCSPKLKLLQVGRAIWTHMTQLESLELDIDLKLEEHNASGLNSCFTGISVENCIRLYEMKEAKQPLALEMEPGSSEVKSPESQLKIEREFPSMLDMKNLKMLTIHPFQGRKISEAVDFSTHHLLWISQKYAFELMPHLKLSSNNN